MSFTLTRTVTRGVVFVHSTPSALCRHLEWALEGCLGTQVSIEWTPQPAAPGLVRGELTWVGEQGTGARIASAIRGFEHLRYEITEDPSEGADGARWSHTPSLGIHHAVTSANGDMVVGEDRLREVLLLAQGDPEAVTEMLEEMLGAEWDTELEVFRHAGDGAPIRWMHRAG